MKTRRFTASILLAAMLLALPGCGGGGSPKDFITVSYTNQAYNINKNIILLGMTSDELYGAAGTTVGSFTGIWPKYNESGAMVSMKLESALTTTTYGTSINSNYADLLPAYAKDPEVTVELDTKEKVIFSKVIEGVKYTVTYRCFAKSGSVKNITITNTAEYTENEADYQ